MNEVNSTEADKLESKSLDLIEVKLNGVVWFKL